MADEPHTIRAINWREVFPFTNIFRAFRVAIHPSKLLLGLAALLVLYIGGRVMDGVWPSKHLANHGEPAAYEQFVTAKTAGDFSDRIKATREQNQRQYSRTLQGTGIVTDGKVADELAKSFDKTSELKNYVAYERQQQFGGAFHNHRVAVEAADKVTDADKKESDKKKAKEQLEAELRAAMQTARERWEGIDEMLPQGVFETFFEYEVVQVNAIAQAAIAFKFDAVGTGIWNFFVTGPSWLIKFHFVYFVIFAVLFLLTWAVFGGAIARIAAVHVARDEKISVRQAIRFSVNKVLSFAFAPIIPLIIILVIGLVLGVGGLMYYIPWVGPILAGVLFFLALIAGVVITLVLLGTFGGFNLMYPTIAVEGSDSFDAISRSFSYVFARPWRMLFYTAVALIYGAITYFFVRFFVWLLLGVTRYFVSWFLTGSSALWFEQLFPEVRDRWALPYDINFAGLKFTEDVGAFAIAFWVYLLIGLVGAFAIAFYFSVNTIIYYLMRREVDATELDDVYIEEPEDEFAEPAKAATPAPVAPATPAIPATSAPAGGVSGDAGSAAPAEPAPPADQPPATDAPPPPPPQG